MRILGIEVMDALENLDDVSNTHVNFDIDEGIQF